MAFGTKVRDDVMATPKFAFGTSSSGTPGTAIASVTAAAGNRLVGMRCRVQTAGATSDVRITVTLSDDTIRTLDVTGSTSFVITVDESGAWRMETAGTPLAYAWSAAIDQGIKSIVATTLAAGVAARYVSIAAIELVTPSQ